MQIATFNFYTIFPFFRFIQTSFLKAFGLIQSNFLMVSLFIHEKYFTNRLSDMINNYNEFRWQTYDGVTLFANKIGSIQKLNRAPYCV